MTQAFNDRTPLQRLLWLGGMAKAAGGKGVEETASGNPVVFTTDLARPLRRLALSLLPRQSGSGDPSPENIRSLLPWGEVNVGHCGKNLIPDGTDTNNGYVSEYYLYADGTSTYNTSWYTSEYFRIGANNKYVLSIEGTAPTYPAICFYTFDKQYISGVRLGGNTSQVITTPSNAYFARCSQCRTEGRLLQFEYGETATDIESYTGQSYPVNLRKNLLNLDELWDNGTNYGSGEVNRYYKLTVPNGKYTVSTNVPNNTNPSVASVFVTDRLEVPTSGYNGVFLNTPKTIDIATNELYIFIRVSSSGGYRTWDKTTFSDYYVQVEEGSTASGFQPYLPPVYGCELHLTTGEVWGTWASFSAKWKDGTSSSVRGDNTRKVFNMPNIFVGASGTVTAYCNIAKWVWDYDADSVHFYLHRNASYVFLPNDTDGETDIFIVGKLETPVLLATLTAQQINAIVGVNTVWSDADGIELTYLKKG